MYLPKYHAWNDVAAMQSHIEAHALGAWVCMGHPQLQANHIPFVLDRQAGPHGRLLGHVSRANPVWRSLGEGLSSVVMFMGPHAYITPSWYPSKTEQGKVVPTWNYVTVHVHGKARAIEDAAWMLDMLDRLTQAQEAKHAIPWRVADAPADYIHQLLHGIVGIEIAIDHLEGKLKLSQDETAADQRGTVQGLTQSLDLSAHDMAAKMMRRLAGNELSPESPLSDT